MISVLWLQRRFAALQHVDAAIARRAHIDATCETVMEQTRRNLHEFVWTDIPSPEALRAGRMAASRAPGLGVDPRLEVLGEPVVRVGQRS